jgi:hypothetical protein
MFPTRLLPELLEQVAARTSSASGRYRRSRFRAPQQSCAAQGLLEAADFLLDGPHRLLVFRPAHALPSSSLVDVALQAAASRTSCAPLFARVPGGPGRQGLVTPSARVGTTRWQGTRAAGIEAQLGR